MPLPAIRVSIFVYSPLIGLWLAALCGSGLASGVLPGPNDVVVRTLMFRDIEPGSETNVFEAIRDFHITRLEWTYLDFSDEDRDHVRQIKSMGLIFGGAGSANMHGGIESFEAESPCMLLTDLEGNQVVQPHMRQWERQPGIGDPTNPEYFEHHLAYWKKVLDMGADVIHRDEPEAPVFAAERYGGGFTPSGISAFRHWLKANLTPGEIENLGIEDVEAFDYAKWLKQRGAPSGDAFATFEDPLKPLWVRFWTEATTAFWQRLLPQLRNYADDREIAVSANNTSLQLWEPFHREFDYANSELLVETAHPLHIWNRAKAAREIGRVQIFGAPKTRSQPVEEEEKTMLLRRVFATAYACGMLAKVPWDVFDQSPDGQARYFAKPEDLADLSGFVRGNEWEGYKEKAAGGPEMPESGADAPRIEGGTGGVYFFVRRRGESISPTLIHLVDWGLPRNPPPPPDEFVAPSGERFPMRHPSETTIRTAPESFDLILPRGGYVPDAQTRFFLAVPAAYDRERHTEAFEQRDYTDLVRRIPLSAEFSESEVRLRIPALAPWGVLEIFEAD